MKRLILMRHAKTEPWRGDDDDHGRALTARGRRTAFEIASVLANKNWVPDKAIVSTATRTDETWACAASVFKSSDMVSENRLYLADQSTIAHIIADHDTIPVLMIIGHNPGLHDLVLRLACEARHCDQRALTQVAETFPPGSVALFSTEQDGPFRPSSLALVDFIHPHRALASAQARSS